MFKVAALIWIVLGTTLTGCALMIVLVVPQLNAQAMRLIPIVCVAAAIVAMPLSMLIAKRIQTQTAARQRG